MDKTLIQKLKDTIAKSNNIGIAVGEKPSIDEMGAALSLFLLLRNANKKVSIASPSDPIVEISSLVGIDKVQKQFGGDAGDLIVSFPYEEGEIEKVSYTLENNYLNIIVKASEQGLSFDEKDIKYTRGSGTIDLLITVGAASLAELGEIFDEQKLSNVTVINIDNAANNQGFGDVVMIEKNASSISEYVADIALTLGFTIEQDAAQNLLSGIMFGTKNFQDPRTTSLAFEISAFLMKRGARRIANHSEQPAPRQEESARPQYTEPAKPEPRYAPMADRSATQPTTQPAAPLQPVASQKEDDTKQDTPPLDWLTPKVYKGSSEV